MYLLIAVLNKGEKLDEIIEAFIKLGIKGATVLDAIGYGLKTSYRFSKIAFIRSSVDEMLATRPKHKVIMSVMQEDVAEKAVDVIKRICETQPMVKSRVLLVPVVKCHRFGPKSSQEA
ncbi:MAG: P-II family nitrogen regulator [Bacillota bacterium]